MNTDKIPSYDKKGNATHYNSERINAIHIFEQTYGTLAVMYFCEINALKYRLRIGKKQSQSLEQEIIKAKWYENAAAYFFEKYNSASLVPGIDNIRTHPIVKRDLPWKDKNNS